MASCCWTWQCLWVGMEGCTRFSAVGFGEVFCTTSIGYGFTLCLTAPHFWKVRISLHKVRLILEARCSSFGYMGWAFKNYYSKFWAFRPLKNSIWANFDFLFNWAFLYKELIFPKILEHFFIHARLNIKPL